LRRPASCVSCKSNIFTIDWTFRKQAELKMLCVFAFVVLIATRKGLSDLHLSARDLLEREMKRGNAAASCYLPSRKANCWRFLSLKSCSLLVINCWIYNCRKIRELWSERAEFINFRSTLWCDLCDDESVDTFIELAFGAEVHHNNNNNNHNHSSDHNEATELP